ncbi:hypothetical protein CO115_01425 [Candidatus Falkowbacteria bacterium CG_4_9_14_3_um_filter_36_9]|nr:MAG: hypothetical protein CO115_01425 [Candidatus Falkowbacteria bacterium CG_4_9_14_3_um_filter_36_9]
MRNYLKFIFAFLFFSAGIFYAGSFASADVVYDFEVSSITANPAKPILNQLCDITVTIKSINPEFIYSNSGLDGYEFDFNDFELSSVVLPEISLFNPIMGGGTFKYVLKGIFTELGEKNLNFTVNKNKSLPETRLINNNLWVKLTVIPPYDLETQSIEISPAKPYAGQIVKVTVKIKNSGNTDLITGAGITSYNINFGDFNFYSSILPEISLQNSFKIGSTTSLAFEGKFRTSGDKNLSFFVDSENNLNESNEDNNTKSKTIYVAPASGLDIAVDSISIKNEGNGTIYGSDMEIKVAIKNTGSVSLVNGDGLGRIDFDYSFNNFSETGLAYGDYPSLSNPLDPGETFTYSFMGKYYVAGGKNVSFAIDVYDILKESNEENNKKSVSFHIYSSQAEIDQFNLLSLEYGFLSSTSTRIKWETSKETQGEIFYRRDIYNLFDIYKISPRISNWPKSDKLTKTHSVDIYNLWPGEKYAFSLRSYRNDVVVNSDLIFFTMPKDDIVKLEGAIGEKINLTAGAVELIWKTNILSSGYVYYKKIGDKEYKSAGAKDLTAEHKVNLENFPEGEYEYYLESKSFNNTYKSVIRSFAIKSAVSDQTADAGNAAESKNTNQDSAEKNIKVANKEMYFRLKGRIILKVEDAGQAYYVNPRTETMYYLGRPEDAFFVMREQGVGITDINLKKIPVGLDNLTGPDKDGDGLPDIFEDAMGTDKDNKDTDGDGFDDKAELSGNYNPNGLGKLNISNSFSASQKGKIFLQVERNGEAWYINPSDGERYFLGRPADAFNIMRNLGLGISNNDFNGMR